MGVFEILIVVVIALVVFGGYFRKQLPQLGRSAGRNARIGGEKAKELADQASGKAGEVGGKVGEKVGDRFDPGDMGRTAGKHVREAREFRDSFKGTLNPKAESEANPKPAPEPAATPTHAATPQPAPAADAAPEAAAEPEAGAEPEIDSEPEVGEHAAAPGEVEEASRRSADGQA